MVAVSGLYYALFRYQFGAPIPASYDVSYWITWKEYLAERATTRGRVLIIGDSSSLFGMDSSVAEKELGRPVVNMSLHGGLPLDWLTTFAEKNAKPGDVVVMPLAWAYYWRDYKVPEDWMVDQIVAWDHGYFDGSSLAQKTRYIAAIKPTAFFRNIIAKEDRDAIYRQFPARKLMNDDKVISELEGAQDAAPNPMQYDFRNLNRFGDMRGACGNARTVGGSITVARVNLREKDLLVRTNKTLKERGVRLILMPAPTIEDPASLDANYSASLDGILSLMREAGIEIAGKARDFYFPRNAFYDTNFHLNCEYAVERTSRMVEALRPAL